MKRYIGLGVVVLGLLGAWAYFGLSAGDAPAGQPPLSTIRFASSFKKEFNAASQQHRLLVLLSPT